MRGQKPTDWQFAWRHRALVVAVLLCAGCAATLRTTPEPAGPPPIDCVVRAHIDYAGNRDYLPSVLLDDPSAHADSVVHYTHEEQYGSSALPTEVQLVNPLHLIGMPTGSSDLVVVARLDVMRRGEVVRSFAAAAVMSRNDTMFGEGETLTEMRRRGLLLLRDNISSQLCADRTTTQAILDAVTWPAPGAQ
jgi:hypothetical protein